MLKHQKNNFLNISLPLRGSRIGCDCASAVRNRENRNLLHLHSPATRPWPEAMPGTGPGPHAWAGVAVAARDDSTRRLHGYRLPWHGWRKSRGRWHHQAAWRRACRLRNTRPNSSSSEKRLSGYVQLMDKYTLNNVSHELNMLTGPIITLSELSALRHFVLDEADQMLSKGFLDQIQETFEYVPRDTQVYFTPVGHQSKNSLPQFVCKFNIFGSHCRSYWSPRHSHPKCWISPASLWGTRGGCWLRGKNSPCKASSSSTSTWKGRYAWLYWPIGSIY